MKIINYFNIVVWYLSNFRYIPNLFFLINNKIREIIFSEHRKSFNLKNLKFSSNNFFFKKEVLKILNFKKKKFI